MDTINTKYYVGFEGYPEIEFICVSYDGKKDILSMWDGYFDSIMYSIEPKESCWVGIAYTYHIDMPWFDESPWRIPNLKIVIEQLTEIDINKLDDRTQEVLKDIIQLLSRAYNAKYMVFISYN